MFVIETKKTLMEGVELVVKAIANGECLEYYNEIRLCTRLKMTQSFAPSLG